MIKVLHNPNCSKSRAILEHLDENNVAFEIIDIINEPLSEDELKAVLRKLDMQPSELIRSEDPFYKEKFGQRSLSEEEMMQAMLEYPSLIQRPVLIKGPVAMIGRPIENLKFFIEN